MTTGSRRGRTHGTAASTRGFQSASISRAISLTIALPTKTASSSTRSVPLRATRRGRAVIELFSDLKRHNMGSRLAEGIDEEGTGAASFLTRTLWGAGSSGPYLHDGRATTITEAILEHGGEAAASRNAFIARPLADKQALIAFVDNLVLFKMEENEVVVPPPTTVQLNSTLRMRMPAASAAEAAQGFPGYP